MNGEVISLKNMWDVHILRGPGHMSKCLLFSYSCTRFCLHQTNNNALIMHDNDIEQNTVSICDSQWSETFSSSGEVYRCGAGCITARVSLTGAPQENVLCPCSSLFYTYSKRSDWWNTNTLCYHFSGHFFGQV